jgi:signal transduction histidine kinase
VSSGPGRTVSVPLIPGNDDRGRTRAARRGTNLSTVNVAPPLLARRLSAAQLLAGDVVLAGCAAALCWYAAIESPQPPATGWHEPGWVSALTGAALGAPVAVRRRHPLAALAVATLVAAAALAGDVIPDYAGAAPTVALGLVVYAVGLSVPFRRSIVATAAAAAVFLVALIYAPDSTFGPGAAAENLFGTLVIGASWALGWTVRERRAHAARLAEQATARAVDDERLRIAREMHDVVAHSMSLIAVKATIANHIAEERPQEVRDALRVIEETSRGALADLRRTLGALRTEAEYAPAPGVADLPALATAATSAGVPVDLVIVNAANLPDGAGLAVFRIVQEALTNVVRHAEARHCRVVVEGAEDAVHIEVTDDGRGGEPAPGGQGLIGMRERVSLYGGRLDAGPGEHGGFRVRASLDVSR